MLTKKVKPIGLWLAWLLLAVAVLLSGNKAYSEQAAIALDTIVVVADGGGTSPPPCSC